MKSQTANPVWNFQGQTVLISAGARGIGRGIVRAFIAAGANVVFGDVDESGGRELLRLLGKSARRAVFVPADFAREDAWPTLCRSLPKRWTPSVFVSNVGIGIHRPIGETPVAEYDQVQAINQRSAWLAARTAEPFLRKRGGSIVLISSIMSRFGGDHHAVYIATKAALLGMTRSLAVELAPSCICVNCILPGFIVADIPSKFRKRVPRELWTDFANLFSSHWLNGYATLQPLKRAGLPEDVAQAVCFLSSPAARFITGTEITVDGGVGLSMASATHAKSFRQSMVWTRPMQQWLQKRHAGRKT